LLTFHRYFIFLRVKRLTKWKRKIHDLGSSSKQGKARDDMLSMITYVLTFVIVAFVLISAVKVHLHLGFHRRVMLKGEVKKSGDESRQTLHEMIFRSSGQDSESLLESVKI